MSSRLRRMKVKDLVKLNDVIRRLKASSEMTPKIQPLKDMQLAVMAGASFGNASLHSQGGQMILAHEPGLKEGKR